jgi:hypothetical protein
MGGQKKVMVGGPHGIRIPTEVHDNTISGVTFGTIKEVSHSYAAAHADWTLTYSEMGASYITVTNASGGAANAILPVADPGRIYVVYNISGQAVTFKVTGQTGIAVATAKTAILVCNVTDIQRVTADTDITP